MEQHPEFGKVPHEIGDGGWAEVVQESLALKSVLFGVRFSMLQIFSFLRSSRSTPCCELSIILNGALLTSRIRNCDEVSLFKFC